MSSTLFHVNKEEFFTFYRYRHRHSTENVPYFREFPWASYTSCMLDLGKINVRFYNRDR